MKTQFNLHCLFLYLVLILFTPQLQAQTTVLVPPGQVGITYDINSEVIHEDSLLKPGKHRLSKDLGIFIITTEERTASGDLPIDLNDDTSLWFEFNYRYSLVEANIGEFVKLFRDDRYRFEGRYLVGEIERLLFEHAHDLALDDLSIEVLEIISEKIKTDFNNNQQFNQYFNLLEVEIWFKTD